MNIIKVALSLVERHGHLLGARPDLVDSIAERYRQEIGSTADEVTILLEERAGLKTSSNGNSGANRLGDPRLRTTYPEERRRALTNRMLRYDDKLAKYLPKVFEAALKRQLAEVELAEERSRDRDYSDANHARTELGVYVEVIEMIDALYNDYGVTRRHYPCLRDEEIRDIAAIILRQPAATVPIISRRNRGGRP